MNMPLEVNILIDEMHKHALKPYLVGGALRDLILGIEPLDYDIAFKGGIEQLEHIWAHHYTGRIDRRHGTLSMSLNGTKAEITLFRKESGYMDARHPGEISFEAELVEDLMRRDFTMNSMAYDFETGEITDPFGALKDIAARPILIRTNREPVQSFTEDALRMVRALRLRGRASLVGEATFTQATKQALTDCRDLVSRLRLEVVHRELMKIWREPNTGDTFCQIRDLGYLSVLFPDMEAERKTRNLECLNGVQTRAMKLAQFACCVETAPMVLYAGLGYSKKACQKAEELYIAAGLLGETDIGSAKTGFSLLREKDRSMACRLYEQFSGDKSGLYVRICEKSEAITVKDLDIGAEDLLDLGLPREQIGHTQRWLLGKVYWNEELNSREILIGLLRERGKIDGNDTD
jgi:tRNA nucleotidyltransferase/poly(A) polymerase